MTVRRLLALTLVALAACSTSTDAGSERRAGSLPASSPSPTSERPEARGYHVLLDAPGPGVLLFGGYDHPYPDEVDPGVWLHDMWNFSADAGWKEAVATCELEVCQGSIPDAGILVGDLPDPARTLAFDSGSGRAVLVGREGTFAHDPATQTWEELGAGGFTTLVGASVAYDSNSDRIVRFGGLDLEGGFNNETWAYDLEADTWKEMHPKRSPPPANYHAAAYDSGSDRIILFGGGDPDGYLAETWAYDYDTDTWTRMSPPTSPPARQYSSMAYDPVGGRMILYGGTDSDDFWDATLDDTWAYDHERDEWTQIEGTGPGVRAWHAMAYDEDAGVIVLFGGGPDRREMQADTWVLDPATDTWSQVA